MIRFIVLLTPLAVFAPLGRAQLRPPEGSEFQLFVENDLLARSDRYYTSGIKLGGVAQRAKENHLDTVEIDLGLVGPSALGRDVQAGWHRLI